LAGKGFAVVLASYGAFQVMRDDALKKRDGGEYNSLIFINWQERCCRWINIVKRVIDKYLLKSKLDAGF